MLPPFQSQEQILLTMKLLMQNRDFRQQCLMYSNLSVRQRPTCDVVYVVWHCCSLKQRRVYREHTQYPEPARR